MLNGAALVSWRKMRWKYILPHTQNVDLLFQLILIPPLPQFRWLLLAQVIFRA